MNFLNAALLFGAAAAAVPLIIHLLHRPQTRTLDWGAMQFLLGEIQHHQRRWRWQEVLLLLLRCAIPILLALAMARPAVRAWQAAPAAAAGLPWFVADASLSTQAWLGITPPTAVEQVDGLESDDDLASALTNAAQQSLASAGRNDVDIDRAELQATANLREAMSMVRQRLIGSADPPATIAIASDFQASELAAVAQAAKQELRSAIAQSARPVELLFLPLIELQTASQSLPNVSITFDTDSDHVVGPDQIPSLHLLLINSSDQTLTCSVTFTIDDDALPPISFTLQPRDRIRRHIPLSPLTTGQHRCRAVLSDLPSSVDSTVADNQATWSIDSILAQKVEIVHGDPPSNDERIASDRPAIDAASLLTLATKPPELNAAKEQTSLPRLFEPQPSRSFSGDLGGGGFHAVIVCDRGDVSRLPPIKPDSENSTLLWLSLSPQMDFAAVEDWLAQCELPIAVAAADQAIASRPLEFLGDVQSPLASTLRQLLRPARVRVGLTAAMRIEPEESASGDRANPWQVETIAQVGGRPYMILATAGRQRVLLQASSLDTQRDTLALSPAFVPVVQTILGDYLVSAGVTAPPSKDDPAGESDLTLSDIDSAQRFVRDCGGNLCSTSDTGDTHEAGVDGVATSSSESQRGTEVWRYILMGLIVVLVGEIAWLNTISRWGRSP